MMGETNKFLSRAPGTLTIVKELEKAEHVFKKTADPNYQYKEIDGEYAGIAMKYIVVHSKEMQAMKEKSVSRKFILATNDMSLNGEQALTLYKGQSRVERGFRFLKDSTFRVSQILLKKTQRIQALLMVMVLTLFVYNYLERELRDRIKEKNETVEQIEDLDHKQTHILTILGENYVNVYA